MCPELVLGYTKTSNKMAKKVFEAPVVKIANFQTMDVIAASSSDKGDFTGGEGDELSKTRIATPTAAGTIQKSGLTW